MKESDWPGRLASSWCAIPDLLRAATRASINAWRRKFRSCFPVLPPNQEQ
jgi:hypothetical protein